jgi:eukaryotic-like serine/threonine-protein kinase
LVAITIGSLILAGAITIGVLYNYTDTLSKLSQILNSNSLNGQWSIFRHDLLHSGATDLSDPLPQGKIQWTFATNGAIQSSPAIADGLVYFGSRNVKIYALNATSGIEQWEYQTGSWVEPSPTIIDGIVYFGSNDSNMYALDARTGEKLWSFKTPLTITSSPAVAGGVVYFGYEDYSIYTLDKLTCRKLWKFKTGGLIT